jgi:hypothetical protein
MRRRFLVCVAILALVLSGVSPAFASSHREAPLISQDPVADNTDVYMFRSPDQTDSVTIVANYLPMEYPGGGPNFYRFGDDVLYEMHVFNNTDNREDITFQFRFKTKVLNGNTFLYNTGPINDITDTTFNVRQTYSVTMIKNGRSRVIATNVPTPPNNIGPKSTPDYTKLATEAIAAVNVGSKCKPSTIKLFAGQRDDPFFVDLGAIFDLLTIRNDFGAHGGGVDGLQGFNCQTIAIQVPIKELTANGSLPTSVDDRNAVIGAYASAERARVRVLRFGKQPAGSFGSQVQVSRLGEPLINEVLIPLKAKDEWNASDPVKDAQFIKYYQDPEPSRLLNALYGLPVPPTPRNDIVAILLTGFSLKPLGIDFTNVGGPKVADLIRLNVAVPVTPASSSTFSTHGILGGDIGGFPNGRRLQDDVTDIELEALAGGTPFTPTFNVAPNNQLGDGVDFNDVSFLETFPYVATPHQGFQPLVQTAEPVH